MKSFNAFRLSPELLRGVEDMGYTTPTPIQCDAIPPALEGRDVLACAMTGSGKTAAFMLPILEQLRDKKRRTTRALVLTPTRELAAQIVEHINALAYHTPMRGAAVYGGVAMGPQENAFKRGVDIIVATPGRLLDHFQYPYAKLAGLEFLVLDEADRMLDMGFLPDIRRILNHVPKKRQTLFFSATLPAPIVELSRDMLHKPATVNIDRKSEPAVGIAQAVYPARRELKPALLLELLNRGSITNVLVFTRTKHRANRLAKFLERNGVSCERIHGNRTQSQRTEALAGFKSGHFQVLVATDIAARGIDVEALSHVVNFDVPEMPDSYIHRVGRTARASATGDAFTFVSHDEEKDLREIEKVLGKRIPRVMLDGFDYEAKKPTRASDQNLDRGRESSARPLRRGGRSRSGNGHKSATRPSPRRRTSATAIEKTVDTTPAKKPAPPRRPFGRSPRPGSPRKRSRARVGR